MWQKGLRLVGLRSTSVRAEQRFTEPLAPLPLVKCVAVWMPMLTHVQASHTDALKTHSLQTFLPHDWEVKGGQQFFGTSISRREIDIGEVPALQGGFPDRKGPFSVLQ